MSTEITNLVEEAHAKTLELRAVPRALVGTRGIQAVGGERARGALAKGAQAEEGTPGRCPLLAREDLDGSQDGCAN